MAVVLTLPLELVTFVAVDVETTGLNPFSEQIVEIAAVKVQGGEVVAEYATLVAIDRTIPFQARQVHGIDNAMLVGQPRIEEALAFLLEFAAESPLVEHSLRAFDVAFLEQAHGGALPSPALSTCLLSRRLFPHLRSHSLEACCQRFGICNDGPHRALPDARATASLLTRLLELCRSRYPLLRDLLRAAAVAR